MAGQFCCTQLKRLAAVRAHPTLNGIDYLEVLDLQAPSDSPRQRTLLVHCLKPVPPLTAAHVQIEGGVRLTPVKVEWAAPADSLPAALVTPAEQAFFSGLTDADRVLVVRTDSAGDYSWYTLALTRSATESEPPEDFDPVVSRVSFSFKVECASEFDCQGREVCPPQTWPTPQIDYLAKDYASFRQVVLDRLAVIMPDWQERHAADLGITLVELLAYVGDQLSYHQDAVATEAYLGTARQRVSVRRHARLLDYAMHDGANARAWVALTVNAQADGQTLPGPDPDDHRPGTLLLTKANAPRGRLGARDVVKALNQGTAAFETLHDLTLYEAHNRMTFYTWGDESCCLPRGATRATLAGTFPHLQVGDVLIFEEVLHPGTGEAADADPEHRHAVRLTAAASDDGNGNPRVDPLTGQPITEIAWDAADALPFPLCLSATTDVEPKKKYLDAVSIARGNVVLADHGRTVPRPELGETAHKLEAVPKGKVFRPRLPQGVITQQGMVRRQDHRLAPFDPAAPAAAAFAWDLEQAMPVVTLLEIGAEDRPWLPSRHLLDSDPFARQFVVEIDNAGSARLRFGDGVLGEQPAPGASFQPVYRLGNGRVGNVGREAIAHIFTALDGITALRNPLPAAGGIDPEPLDRVRQRVPVAFRKPRRAVTPADYAVVAEGHPEVQKAVATLRWTGSWHTLFLALDRKGGRPVDLSFIHELKAYLDAYRLAGHDLEIEPPQYVPLDLAITVCVAPGYFREAVQEALLSVLGSGVRPDGQRGFFHPDNFTFGQAVHLSQVTAAAMQVPGVQWVDLEDAPGKPNRFRRWGRPPVDEWAQGRIDLGRLEIACLLNDANAPEMGRIEFFMEGGT